MSSPMPPDEPSDEGIWRFLYKPFIFSIMGGLQIGVVFTNLLCVSLLGSALTFEHPVSSAYWNVSGLSFYAFLFLVAFWCFMTSLILAATCATSYNTATTLPTTTFYLAYHGVASAFFLFGTLALLAEAAKYEAILSAKHYNLKSIVFAGGSVGAIVTGLYVTITVFGVILYRKSSS